MLPDLEPFFDRVRALFPDTRGHGLSTRFERVADYTYARKAEDLLRWVDALAIREAVWGGASMGGALSLWIAAHAPERARAVVSISGPPFEPTAEDKAWWARHRPLVEAVGPLQGVRDGAVHVLHGLEDPLAAEPLLVAVAQFNGLGLSRRSPRGDRGAAHGAVAQDDLRLDGGVAARIQDLATVHFGDFHNVFLKP